MHRLPPPRASRLAVACLMAFAAACAKSPTSPALPDDPVDGTTTEVLPPAPQHATTGFRIEVTPATISLALGASQQFTAVGRDEAGTKYSVQVAWKTTGGTVSTTGLYKAPSTAGTYRVIATRVGDVLADTSVITVGGGGTTSTPVKIELSPSSVTLAPAATKQFTATGRDKNGALVTVRIVWRAIGGTVTSAGLYTAPSSTGSFKVIATREGDVIADTAVVAVSSSGTGTVSLANECSRARPEWIWCDDFDTDRLARYFEYSNASGRFTRSSGVGNGGSYGMKAVYSTTTASAGFLHLAFGRTPQAYFRPVDAGTANYREVYWRIFVRYPSNWQGGGGMKLSRATSFVSSSSWAQSMIAHVWSGGSAPYSDYLYIDPASGTDAAGNVKTTTYNDFARLRWLGAVQGRLPLFSAAQRTTWHCVEAHARLNTAGYANGLFEMWIDGQLDATKSGINWVGSYSAYGINAVFVENYWNNGAPAVQERYLDNFVVSRTRIGCGT